MASPAAVAYAQQRASAAAAANAKQQGNAPLHDLERVARIATSKIKSLEAQSKILSKDEVEFIPKFFLGELSLGKVLGKGGFGTVKEIRTINCKADVGVVSVLSLPSSLKDLDVNGLKVQAKEDKKFIADHCLRESGDARYCIKVNLLFVNRRSTDAQCSFYFSLFHTIRQLISPPSTIINQPGPLTRYHERPRSIYPGCHRHVRRNHVPRRRVPPSHHHHARFSAENSTGPTDLVKFS
jgi:hypothetical protein